MPPIGRLLGKADFSNLFINLSEKRFESLAEAKKAGAATINYGLFINFCLEFFIISFVVFLLVKQINRLKKQSPPLEPNMKDCPFCLSAIPLKAVKCCHCTSELGEK
jgi:large conductance mechanosensitive channel